MTQKTLTTTNNSGSLMFTSGGSFSLSSTNLNQKSTGEYNTVANSNISIKTKTGFFEIHAETDTLALTSNAASNTAIEISATNPLGGILTTTGSGGYSLITSNGDISLLSQGSNINIGVSPVGRPANQQTQDITIECFNNMNTSAGDMYFVSSDVISFVSNTGDIQFGTSSNGTPVVKFENGNVLINQAHSDLDYQLDIAITHPSDSNKGFNGIVVNSFESNVASDLTLQTSNTLGDGTQCILSMGSFGSNNSMAIFQTYLAYQTGNTVIRLDGPTYAPNESYIGFGHDFSFNDIGRSIYWPTLDKEDIIESLGVFVSETNDTSNVIVQGVYTGNNSRVYLLQIDSIGNPNTFMWSNNGGLSFVKQFVPIINTTSWIGLDDGLQVKFTQTTGFSLNQQFIFQTKITAQVGTTVITPTDPTTFYTLQPFYSYIKTATPSDIVIKTNNTEKMRITGDGSIGIQQKIPAACLDLNSNYNKVLLVNQTISGYQINPSVSYLTSGGYVLVWNSQDDLSQLNFNIVAQRYLADGSRYGTNFPVNITTSENQSFPSVSGSRSINSNHYIITWSSQASGIYKVYYQIYHNNLPIRNNDIPVDPSTSVQLYARAAGLYNGNYIITWSADNTGSGIYSIWGAIIADDANGTIINKFQISTTSPYNANFPYPAGLPSDDRYVPDGFVVGFMTALDNTVDPRYTIAVRVMNSNGTPYSAQIPITAVGNLAYSSISDGLLSVAEINQHIVNSAYGNGGFVMSFYRNYQADTSLYAVGDNVLGLTSGATATVSALDPVNRIITVQNISNRLLIGEEIDITSSIPNVGTVIEKIQNINFLTNTTANITLDTGSKNVVAYRFKSNITQTSDAIWYTQVNTSPLFADADRFSGNVNVFEYKRPLAVITVNNQGTGIVSWSNGSIPSVYYQLLDIQTGGLIGNEERLTSGYDGLKQRDQVVTQLQSIEGNDYGFIISWDNQSLDLLDTGVYQQLIGYEHSLLSLADGNSNFIFNHQSQCGIGTNNPQNNLHIQSPSTSSFFDPANPAGITIQNTSLHAITTSPLQTISFEDGTSNTISIIRSGNSLRYDDLYPYPENLIGFYKFDETEGTQTRDSSPYSYFSNVYINTSAILVNFDIENCWGAGLINNALLFDGDNDYCFIENTATNNLNTALETAQKMSFSFWLKIPSDIVHGSTYDIVSNGGNLSLAGTYIISVIDSGNNGNMKLGVIVKVDQPYTIPLYSTTPLNDNKWHHIAVSISLSGGNCTINAYIDGTLNCTTTNTGTIATVQHGSYKTYIGTRDAAQKFYRGYIDEFRFYNTVLTINDIQTLYNYGNPNKAFKGALIMNANDNPSYNLGIVLDDTGKLNNLNSKPLPYSILTGELIAYQSNVDIYGIGTAFTNELTVGDYITLDIASNHQFIVISIINDTHLTIDQRAYTGPEVSKSYLSVLRRPSIYTFFDNGDNIKGNIDNYGNLMLGSGRASTMLEISGTSTSAQNIPAITLSNITQENGQYTRKTAINFQGYDSSNTLNPPVNLGHIETTHQGTGNDKRGIMRFFTNDGSQENNILSLTSNGYVDIGGQNTPLTNMHITSISTTTDCGIILQSAYNSNTNPSVSGIFDERSDLYFAGLTSITETVDTNIKKKVLAAVSGSNDGNAKRLDGRLDFQTNNQNADNGIETRMSITHTGYIGMGIMEPTNFVSMQPELRNTNNEINNITSAVFSSGNTTITVNNFIFSGLSSEQKKMFIGGTVVIGNATLTTSTILSVIANNQFLAVGNLSAFVGLNCYVHYAGLNVSNNTGYIGVNTSSPTAPLTINGAVVNSITTITSNTTLDISHYTVLGNTTANNITITLPTNTQTLKGRVYKFKNIGTNPANTLYIDPANSNIDITYNSSNPFPLVQGLGFSTQGCTLKSDGVDCLFSL